MLAGCGAPEPRHDGRSLSEWSAVLADRARAVPDRRAAADALGQMACRAPADVLGPLAAARAGDPDEEVRRRATVALGAAGVPARPALVAALDDESPRVVETALAALGGFGPDALPVADELAKRLRSPVPAIAHQASLALGRLSPGVLPVLERHREDADPAVRALALDAWARAGGDDPRAAAGLVRWLADPEWTVRRRAAEALARHAHGQAVREGLTRALEDANPFVVASAARSLGAAGEAAAPAVPR